MAAAGLSTLLVSAATAPMFAVQRLARILAVCLRALAESKNFTVSQKMFVLLVADSQNEATNPCLSHVQQQTFCLHCAVLYLHGCLQYVLHVQPEVEHILLSTNAFANSMLSSKTWSS